MARNRKWWWIASWCICHWTAPFGIGVVCSADAASVNRAIREVSEYWASTSGAEDLVAVATDADAEVRQVQLISPARQPSFRTAQRGQQRSRAAATDSGLSGVPFMIGDTGAGSCGGVTFDGTSLATIEHPTFACSRLNIAENNSALPQDREFFSYRHFHNLSETEVFGFSNALESEQFTLGMERLLFRDDLSLEMRVPVSRDLNSNVDVRFTPTENNLPLSDRNAEFGNMSFLLKKMLMKRRNWIFSGGVAINVPTADDIRIRSEVDANITVIRTPPVGADADFIFDSLITNETVNLSPFLAWAYDHHSRWFHQGFFQIDIPLNRSETIYSINGVLTPNAPSPYPPEPLAVSTSGPIDQQTLMRLNLGWGYWLHRGSHCDFLQGIAALFEVHYTSTLDGANAFSTQIANFEQTGFPSFPVDLVIGNQVDNIDVVNLTTGVTIDLDAILITNGFTAPVTTGASKPFDFEYNLQVQHRY